MVTFHTPDYPDYFDYDDRGNRSGDDKDDLYIADDADYDAQDTVDVKENDITVAAPKAKNVLFIALGGLVILLIMYNVVFADKRTDDEISKDKATAEAEAQPIIKEKVEIPPSEDEGSDYVAVVDAPEIPDFIEAKSEQSIIQDDDIPFIESSDLNDNELFGDLFAKDTRDIVEEEEAPSPDIKVFEPIRVNPNSEVLDMPLPEPVKETKEKVPLPPKPKGPSEEDKRKAKETELQERQRLKELYGQGFAAQGLTIQRPDDKASASAYIENTEARQISATTIGNADNVIGQGKTIEAILETAINTELDGPVRAIVSRDIYSETGRRVLIPRGSRLSGGYQTALLGDTGCRLSISWQRVILPDGTDINISLEEGGAGGFPATDQLGRAGICGHVDDKYFETVAAAALLSTVTIAAAGIADKISAQENAGTQSTTTQPDGAVTQTNNQQSAVDQTILTSLSSFGRTAGEVITKILGNGRVIIIPQGTRMRVFVQNDVVFPNSASKLLP